jgi:hypothetical protein
VTTEEAQALIEARAEVAACLEFLRVEMEWDAFRVEQLYFDNERKRSRSEDNFRKLKNYLVEKGHGIALLKELHELRKFKEEHPVGEKA